MAHIDADTARAAELVMAKFGRSVTYRRGAYSATLTAARARRPSRDLEEERFQTTSDRFRFLIQCSTLVLNSAEVLPAEGDKIEEITNGKKFTWEVLPDDQARCWDYFDTGNAYVWARVKEHKTEAAP
jgi:hypothetical protein